MTSYTAYEKSVCGSLWTWACQHHQGELDGGKREGRPPVIASKFREKNVLVPPNNESKARDIRDAVPYKQRHQWFGSLKSSQALAQSVFGALHAFDRLDLLQDVSAECGATGFLQRQQWLDAQLRIRGGQPRRAETDQRRRPAERTGKASRYRMQVHRARVWYLLASTPASRRCQLCRTALQ